MALQVHNYVAQSMSFVLMRLWNRIESREKTMIRMLLKYDRELKQHVQHIVSEVLRDWSSDELQLFLQQLEPVSARAGRQYQLVSNESEVMRRAQLSQTMAAITEGGALCINRQGEVSIRERGYAIASYSQGTVWISAIRQQFGNNRNMPRTASHLKERRRIVLAHLLKTFEYCDHEWVWFDFGSAVMSGAYTQEEAPLDKLCEMYYNSARMIYSQADKVVIINNLLLGLETRSKIDVAVALCLSDWRRCSWSVIEARLSKKVVVRTRDCSFDLDEILYFLWSQVKSDEHRYWGMLKNLWYFRPIPLGLFKSLLLGTNSETQKEPENILKEIYLACEHCSPMDNVEAVSILFPLLGLQWSKSFSAIDGLMHILAAFPQAGDPLGWYAERQGIKN